MKTPNYKDTQGKHPIPHAKGVAEDETRANKSEPKKSTDSKHKGEEE